VVTWNRRELLAEALAALRSQSLPTATIVVVDNASTDGTDVALRGESDLDVVRLEQNTGGAGGFAVGI
jgi:rhamnopyranosyl-N-acetylglucosaminyl-diphospho-decaprenol beta-1,3/1,4-galactofuranosyltransferase